MILDAIMGVLIALFTGILGLFPAYTLPASMTDFGLSVGGSLSTANGLFPVVTLGICLGVIIAARLFIAAFAAISWAYGKIPFKMT